ncbi:hypothetical protein D3M59_10110 [Sphingomonas edaphi]|uniref:Uncharacterized protein n=1 Tax=Sphingomonas edaphi TaxID=2315689 RepID=A0A418PZ93_9SPHN|nr:hypothetical protein D3M59_10110 [Sphingomonas edaphi]
MRARIGAKISVRVKPPVAGALQRQVIDAICEAIDTESTMVVQADPVGFGCQMRAGVFGKDEDPPC